MPRGPDRSVDLESVEHSFVVRLGIDAHDGPRIAQAVGMALEQIVSAGEIEDVRAHLPQELRQIFPSSHRSHRAENLGFCAENEACARYQSKKTRVRVAAGCGRGIGPLPLRGIPGDALKGVRGSMTGYVIIAGNDEDANDLYGDVVTSEGFEAVVARDADEARRIIGERGAPRVIIADLEMARNASFRMMRDVQSSFPPGERPAIIASVSRALRTTASDLTDTLGIAEVIARGANPRSVALAIKRALDPKQRDDSKTDKRPPAMLHRARGQSSIKQLLPPPVIQSVAASDDEAIEQVVAAPAAIEKIDDRERLRLARIAAMGLVDELPPDVALQELVLETAEAFDVPIALVSLSLEDTQWFKAHVGLSGLLAESRTIPRDDSFCTHVVESGQPLMVPDAAAHPTFRHNVLVEKGIVGSYAGAPLTSSDGDVLGALCILHPKPAGIDPVRVELLTRVAKRFAGELELRSKARSRALEVIRLTEKLAEERQAHSYSRKTMLQLEGVLAHLDGGVLVMDGGRRVVYANAAAADLLGIAPDRLVGMSYDELVVECSRRTSDPGLLLQKLSVPPDGPFAIAEEVVLDEPRRRLRWSSKPIDLSEGNGQLTLIVDLGEGASVASERPLASGSFAVVLPASASQIPKRASMRPAKKKSRG